MALVSRSLNPFSETIRPRVNLHVDLQDRKPFRSPDTTIAYVLPIGMPVVFDVSLGAWAVVDGNEITAADEVTIRGFIAEEHLFEDPGATNDELVLVMLKGKLSQRDIPRLANGDLTIFDALGGNDLLLATSAELELMLQGVAPGGGAVPSTTLRELGITVTDVPLIN